MAAKDPTQKAKLTLRAIENSMTTDVTDDYYVRPKTQKCLTMKDLAAEMVALSTRQEDPAEVESTGNSMFQRMMWFLSAGYSISTPMGVIRLNAKGNLRKSELLSAPDRSRILLDLSLSMSAEMRRMLDEVELDVEIQQSATGPVLIGITSGFNAENPERAAKGEGVPITPGQPCVIRGKRIKVGGRVRFNP